MWELFRTLLVLFLSSPDPKATAGKIAGKLAEAADSELSLTMTQKASGHGGDGGPGGHGGAGGHASPRQR